MMKNKDRVEARKATDLPSKQNAADLQCLARPLLPQPWGMTASRLVRNDRE